MEPSEQNDLEDARQALEQLEERLRRDVADMVHVLEADVPAQFVRTIRQVFERSERADDLGDAALGELKADTLETSKALTREVVDALRPVEAWSWDPAWRLPQDPQDLEAHPRVSEALARVGQAMGDLLERHGIPRSELGERAGYRLPAYFVAGHFMKSLVSDYWRVLADHHQLRERIAEGSQAEQRRARRERWEQA